MNLTRLIVTLVIALLCIGMVALAGPIPTTPRARQGGRGSTHGEGRSSKNNNNHNRDNARRTKSGRRLRMLRKILKSLSSEEVRALQVRSKKDSRDLLYEDFGEGNHYLGHMQPHPGTTGEQRYQPEIDCPTAMDGMQLFACPSADVHGVIYCIDDLSLCNDKYDCPNGEDENRTVCMFHKLDMSYIKFFTDAILGPGADPLHSN